MAIWSCELIKSFLQNCKQLNKQKEKCSTKQHNSLICKNMVTMVKCTIRCQSTWNHSNYISYGRERERGHEWVVGMVLIKESMHGDGVASGLQKNIYIKEGETN